MLRRIKRFLFSKETRRIDAALKANRAELRDDPRFTHQRKWKSNHTR
jgi:hypothetical protein